MCLNTRSNKRKSNQTKQIKSRFLDYKFKIKTEKIKHIYGTKTKTTISKKIINNKNVKWNTFLRKRKLKKGKEKCKIDFQIKVTTIAK